MAESKLDRQRRIAKDLREENRELEAAVDRPPLTAGRVGMRIGTGVSGTVGAVVAGMTHGRKMGDMLEGHHLTNFIGGISQLAKFGMKPDGFGDLITELPITVMRCNIAIGIKEARKP